MEPLDTSLDATESVSKGCFVFKGKKNTAKMSDYFCRPDKSKAGKSRLKLFHDAWREVSSEIEKIQTDMNENMFQELLTFIKTSAARLTTQNHNGTNQSEEIPTAALLTGVNTSDHSAMFSQLTDLIHTHVTPHVAVLRPRDCSHLKNTLTSAISQLTQSSLSCDHKDGDDDDDDDDDDDITSSNMAELKTWYSQKYEGEDSPVWLQGEDSPVDKSPKKRRSREKKTHVQLPALVIVFEGLGRFSASVIQDFIIICHNYITHLPIVLVFGIATTINIIHRLLSNSVSSLLSIDKFSALPSSNHLTQLINQMTPSHVLHLMTLSESVMWQVLLTPRFHFKLGARVFQLLLDIFLYHDFSVITFTQALKFAMLDHYCSQPSSSLCLSLNIAIETVESFNNASVDSVRRLPSMMKYVERQSKDVQFKLLLDDSYTKKVIVEKLIGLETFHANFYPFLQGLHTLTSQLPHHPLGKQIRELYGMCLETDIVNTETYAEALSLLKCLSKDELIETLMRTREALTVDENCVESVRGICECITQALHSLSHIHEVEDMEDASDEATVTLPKKTDLHNLRKTLDEMKKNKTQSPYESLRVEIIDKLSSFFKCHLPSPSSLPLHEAHYYDSITAIKHTFHAAPRSSLQTALSSPHHYLQCTCCKSEGGVILASMPDICIVYKLHLECGCYINLYDWLQAFRTVVGESETETSSDDLLQARFIRAVSELQFLGFIKATKRKTDHVARLTWGGC